MHTIANTVPDIYFPPAFNPPKCIKTKENIGYSPVSWDLLVAKEDTKISVKAPTIAQ